jgi:hypothetical protein
MSVHRDVNIVKQYLLRKILIKLLGFIGFIGLLGFMGFIGFIGLTGYLGSKQLNKLK